MVFTCHFGENQFFTNKSLTQTLFYVDGEVVKAKGTKIEWKNNPTVITVEKKQVNRRTKKTRMVKEEVQQASFFEIFGDFSVEENGVHVCHEDSEPLNLYSLDDLIDSIVQQLPYALEFYLNVVEDEFYESKTDAESQDPETENEAED